MSTVLVWVLVGFIHSQPIVIDNIATQEDCTKLKASLALGLDSSPSKLVCQAVKKTK